MQIRISDFCMMIRKNIHTNVKVLHFNTPYFAISDFTYTNLAKVV